MDHIGVDVHKKDSHICLLAEGAPGPHLRASSGPPTARCGFPIGPWRRRSSPAMRS